MARFFAGTASDGNIRIFDIPASAGRCSKERGNVGSIYVKMPTPMYDPDAGTLRYPRELDLSWLVPDVAFLGFEENGTIVECGIVNSVSTDMARGTIEVQATGMMDWVNQQLILANPASANVVGNTVTFSNYDLRTIVKKIVARIIAYPGHEPNITTPEADISGTSTYKYAPTDTYIAGEEIRSIEGLEDGPESELRPVFTDSGGKVEWQLKTGNPQITQQDAGERVHYNLFRDPFATSSSTLTNFLKTKTGILSTTSSTTRHATEWAGAPSFRTVFTGRQVTLLFSVNAQAPQPSYSFTNPVTRILGTVYNSTSKPMFVKTSWDNGDGTTIHFDDGEGEGTVVDPGVTTQIIGVLGMRNMPNGRRVARAANWVGFTFYFQESDAAKTAPIYMKNVLIDTDMAGAFFGHPTTAFSGDTTDTAGFDYQWEGSQYASRSVRTTTGIVLPDHVWTAVGPDPAITQLHVTQSSEDFVTEVIEVGTVRDNEGITWSPNLAPISWREADENRTIPWQGDNWYAMRRMRGESRSDVVQVDRLELHALGALNRGGFLRESWEFELRRNVQPVWGAFNVGDYFRVSLGTKFGPLKGDHRLRIQSVTYATESPNTLHITATPYREL